QCIQPGRRRQSGAMHGLGLMMNVPSPSPVPAAGMSPTSPSHVWAMRAGFSLFPQLPPATCDISHVLASAFKDLYTEDVLEEDVATNWIESQGGDSVYQDSYTDELEKVQVQTKSEFGALYRLTEADRAEKEIIRAQARAKREEARVLKQMKIHAGKDFPKLGLPPVASSFRWIVNNELLRKNNLICPEDYITEKLPLAKAPKALITHMQLPFSSSSRSLCFIVHSCFSKKTEASQKRARKESKSWKAEELSEYLSRLEKRQNYLKNPRFFPPNTLDGGKSLVISQDKVEEIIARRKAEDGKGIFYFFLMKMTVEVRNITSTGQHVRLIPPSSSVFFIWPGKYPGKGGMIAPGMACQYTVQFIPENLGEYEDHILVESQVSESFVIPVQAKVSLPVLTLPDCINCGSCLVGGIKTTTILCRNEGVRTGKFSIMPGKAWPAPDSGVAATADFVVQDPFGIQPAGLELAPGQNATVQVSAICCRKVFCLGEMIALELLFVTGGESKALLGEVTDATAQHLIRFEPQNPRSTKDKILLIRNSTNLELPFFWQITKPHLKPLIPEETADFTEVKTSQDPESAFSLNPKQGVLLPYADHEFILTYAPQELKSYHSVLQMVVRNTPDSPCLVEERMLQNNPECRVEDVIALKIEVKGSTEPYNLLLEPYAIIIPGENFIGVNVKKKFKLWNNSKTLIKYTWERITDCEIIEVEPRTGVIDVNKCCEFLLAISGSKPGVISRKLPCHVELCPEPVMLHIEAAFKGPSLCIDVPSLQFGLTKQGETVSRTFEINNLSQVPAQWRMQESQVFLAQRNEEVSTFTIQPSAGEIPPLGLCTVSVHFTSLQCQRLQTVLELEVENGEGSHLPVFVEVQTPQVCLISSHLVFNEIYTGVPVKATNKLFNQTLLPAKYLWQKPIGSQAASCSIVVSPASGTLGPNEEREFCIELSANTVVSSQNIRPMSKYYCYFSGSDEGQMPQSPCELLLDFGSEVAVKDVVKHQLILTNLSGIRAPFTLEAEYFSASSFSPSNPLPYLPHCGKLQHSPSVISDFAAALLSQGKGAAFHIQPSSGTLEAFQQLTIEIAAYNNMWGEYQDNLVCKVGGILVLPFKNGKPKRYISIQILLPDTNLIFWYQLSHEPSLTRSNCPFFLSHSDIRLDLEVYNQEPDDEKLVDLLVLFGDPFPPVDMAGKESASSGSSSESKAVLNRVPRFLCNPRRLRALNALSRPQVVPGGGSSDVYISFTPLVIPDTEAELSCAALLLGFMSLDSKVNWLSQQGQRGISFPFLYLYLSRELKLTSSESFLPQVLTDAVITQSLKLLNCTKVRLYFRLFLSTPSMPFSLSGSDPKRSTETSHSKKEERKQQLQHVLYPQQNMLVQVSFHTSLELLRYQHLPETQLLPGCQVLQLESGEKKLKFHQNLVIEHSNCTTQLVPVTAYLTLPVLELSCDRVDFQTCFVAQTKTEHVFLYNRSGCRSYWTALLGILKSPKAMQVFSIFPTKGILEAREGEAPTREILQISFAARYS
uniref:DLEC1 cilia and flagella associated protein n=1 Tax=Junco hyemalis TaxID=40217 RepID=A0A8C5NJU2_JUNHY